jgi:hypothetical protein
MTNGHAALMEWQNRNDLENTCSSVSLSTNPTWSALGLNTYHRREQQVK